MVIKELIPETSSKLKANSIENYMFEANLIIRTILSLSPLDVVLKGNTAVSEKDVEIIQGIITRRISGEPLQYILESQEFMGLSFYVNPSVLIPRQDTEVLVEHILDHYKGAAISVLDICSGSGAIGISIAHFNKNAYVKGLEISPEAIKVSEKNAELLGVSERVSFICQDILKTTLYGKYNLIVSNPPYIESSVIPTLSKTVKSFEPAIALDGGDDGLIFYRHITNIAPHLLTPGGMLAFEIGYNQGIAVSEMMKENFSNIEVIKDYGGNDRVVRGIIKKEL